MAFIELKPLRFRRNKSNSTYISVNFQKIKTKRVADRCYLLIIIPISVLKEINTNINDKVLLYYDDENPRIFLVRKKMDENNENNGYNLSYTPTRPSVCKITKYWDNSLFKPSDKEFVTSYVKSEIISISLGEKGLKIYSDSNLN